MTSVSREAIKISKFFLNFLNLSVNFSQKPMGFQSPLTHAASVLLTALRAQLTSSPRQPLPAGSSHQRCWQPLLTFESLSSNSSAVYSFQPPQQKPRREHARPCLNHPAFKEWGERKSTSQTHLLCPKVTTGDNTGALPLPREKETFHLMTHHQGWIGTRWRLRVYTCRLGF